MIIYMSVRSGKQVISTSESFDRVKLQRLKYLQLQANKYLSKLNYKWLVSLFTVMESLIFENTDSMNIVCEYGMNIMCQHVACLDALSVRDVSRSDEHAGSVAEPVVSFGSRVNSELVPSMRNTERMIRELFPIFTVQFNTYTQTGVPTGANIQNIRSAGHSVLAGNLLRWHETCWKARFKTITC